ncbi:zinc-binding dehydrogenase [Pyrobaculum aerophilum]|nr:zinc-binding dehydrogenase [Pyrobaculum aerophilum]
MVRLLEAGRIKAFIHNVYSLADVRKALEELRSPERVGKVLIAP